MDNQWLFFLFLPFVPLLAAAVMSRLYIAWMQRRHDSVPLGAPACGGIASMICLVGLCLLLVAFLPGRPGGGNPWGHGQPTIAFIVVVAGVYAVLGALVGCAVTFLVWLSARLASGAKAGMRRS
jgi:nitrate reductase NapE component